MVFAKDGLSASKVLLWAVIIGALPLIKGCNLTPTPAFFDQLSYSEKTLDISTETDDARATFWRTDGKEVFLIGRETNDVVSYTTNAPWQIANAAHNKELDLSGEVGSTDQDAVPHGLYFREDGLKMWVFNRTEIWAYTLDSAWDISNAENTGYADLSNEVVRGHDIDFRPDGKVLFLDDREKGAVYAFRLEEPWQVEQPTLEATLDISHRQQAVRGLEIVSGGMAMLLMDTGRNQLLKYSLTSPYDIASAQFSESHDVAPQTMEGRGLSLSHQMDRFFITARDREEILKFEMVFD